MDVRDDGHSFLELNLTGSAVALRSRIRSALPLGFQAAGGHPIAPQALAKTGSLSTGLLPGARRRCPVGEALLSRSEDAEILARELYSEFPFGSSADLSGRWSERDAARACSFQAGARPLSVEKAFQEGGALGPEMSRDLIEDGGERADPQGVVSGDRHVMFPALLRGEAEMAAGPPGDLLAETFQSAGKLTAGEVSRQPHAAMISSRT